MKIKTVIQMVILLGAQVAWAGMPIVNLNKAVESTDSVNCQRTTQEKSFRDLIVKAAFHGADDRKLLSQNLKVVGFNDVEQEQAMRCTGLIYCPGGKKGRNMQSAGAVCPPGQRGPNGKCAADRIGSVGHMFIDKDLNKYVSQIEKCEFTNYRGHKTKLVVDDIKDVLNPNIDTRNPHKNMRSDKLVIRLQKPIPGCDPYDIRKEETVPPVGSELIALTHIQEDHKGIYNGTEPLAYTCQVTRTFSARVGPSALFYNNCDMNGVGSGGFAFTRDDAGKLQLAAMFIRSGDLKFNGKDYNEADKHYTVAIGTNADFSQLANNPGVPTDSQYTQSDRPTLRPTSGD